jgi:hypothetical protein
MNGVMIAQLAKEQLAVVTGLVPDEVSELGRGEDGWQVTVEMVELKRIPASMDMLGSYESIIDDEGQLVNYKRVRRYSRGDTTEQAA